MRQSIKKLKIILNSNTFLAVLILVTLSKIFYFINHVNSVYDIDTNKISGIVTQIKTKDDFNIYTISGKENILVYYNKDLNVSLGDKVQVSGILKKLNHNTIFNQFDYSNYMLSFNTYYKMNSYSINILKKNEFILYKIKNIIINKIKHLRGSEYLNAFILGDTSGIKSSIMDSFRTNGINHLFSISGMHVGLLSMLLLFLLNKIKKSDKNFIVISLFLIFFMAFVNFTKSVVRSTLFFIFLNLNKILKLNLRRERIFLILLIIILFINPYNIYNISFIFSYTISFYLILFSDIINKGKGYFKKLLIASFISFFASIPILINTNFSINIISILNNIIFIPFVSLIIFPFSLIVLLVPSLDFLYLILINILENFSLFMLNFKIEIIFKHINIIFIILYYILITFIILKISSKKYKYIFFIIVVLFIHSNINCLDSSLYVTFIDVNQGDSTLLRFPFNKGNILIDTGGNLNYDISNSIIKYLKSEGVKKINYLILTHGDFDHMGESIKLINYFKVDNVIFNCGPYNDLEKELIKILEKKNIEYYSCIKELNIDDYKLKFLNTKKYDNENDNSSVIYFNYNNYKFLFMGDSGIQKEKDILEKYNLKNLDFLKVGHHGSNTSSSKSFMDEINPKYSIISVGKNNRYGHPNDVVLKLLEDSKIYRTDQDGSIMFKIKDNKLQIETCIP